jgi:RND family efflux transporter MFP subunit
MKRSTKSIVTVAIIVLLLVTVYRVYRGEQPSKSGQSSGQKSEQPVASVKVATIRDGSISTHVKAYGEVVPAPGALQVLSVPYESQVIRVMVSDAQRIARGDDVVEIGPSPDTSLSLDQATNEYKASGETLEHVKELHDLKLATNNQLLQAQQKHEQARLKLESLRQRGVDGNHVIHSPATGLVHKVNVHDGAIVSAGSPLADIIAGDKLEVRLEMEPEDVARLKSGQSVLLNYVNVPEAKAVKGSIRKISRSVNSTTRLVDVLVALPAPSDFLLGEYVAGKATTASASGLVVPRSAVLPEEDHHVLFTLSQNRAKKHTVRIDLRNSDEAVVSGKDLRSGEKVIILGNYELKDGMPVKVGTSQ